VAFLRYDATKASIDEAMTTKRPFCLHCLQSSVRCEHDRIRSVRMLGPSSVHSPYAKATAGVLNRRRDVQMSQMRLWVELELVNSPGWSLLLAGVVFLRTGLMGNAGPTHDKLNGCVCEILRELGLCSTIIISTHIIGYLCILAICAYLVFTNRILHCVNTYVIRIINCLRLSD